MKNRKNRPLLKLLVDTCVWLDLAKDHQQQPTLFALEELARQGELQLILPRIIVDEFARNKARIIEDAGRSLSSTLKRVKEAVDKFGDRRRKQRVLQELNDVDHRIPTLGSAVSDSIGRVEALFASSSIIEISDSVKLRAAQRAIDKKAPFHRQRNGMDDAILIETYADECRRLPTGTRAAFVTHNTKDFSQTNGDVKLPHPDIADCFSRIKSIYSTRIGEVLKRIWPEAFEEIVIEQGWVEEPRGLPEILEAIDFLFDQVWYGRHQVLRHKVETGKTKIVEREIFPVKDHSRRPIQRDIWEGARKAAARVEKKRGLENLGPWTDFDWGMINGKLSALRWVLGDEWDFLDT